MKRTLTHRGFTLIELLVVVAIIGILATVVLASLNSAQNKANDARRKADLRTIATALEMYAIDNNTYCVAGGASGGTGRGFFNLINPGGGYPDSVSAQLVAGGYLSSNVIDPSGSTYDNQNGRSGYMIYCDSSHFTVWANLEDPSTSDTATLSSCHFSSYDNYDINDPVSTRQNYCVSN